MSKMGLHEPFRHLQHKLWQKERSRIKLVVWLLTTKSRESTQLRCVHCDTPLENSQRELQLCFRPRPNRSSEQRVIALQSCGSPNRDNSGLFLGSPRTKSHSDVDAAERRREYYMWEGGGFPQIRAVVSTMSPKSFVACPSTEAAPESELTNLLVGLMQIRGSN
jgi:hypothetical protein